MKLQHSFVVLFAVFSPSSLILVSAQQFGGCKPCYRQISYTYTNTRNVLETGTWVHSYCCVSSSDVQPTDGSLRLVNGSSRHHGTLEMVRNGAYRRVCSDNFDAATTRIACFVLGLTVSGWSPEPGNGQTTVKTLSNCTAAGTWLGNCSDSGSLDCSSGEQVGIQCQDQLGIRLSGGATLFGGRVEHYHNGAWGTVCDSGWTLSEATVVCRELGFGEATAATLGHAPYVTGRVMLSSVDCTGHETDLRWCLHAGLRNAAGCSEDYSRHAGVQCAGPVPSELSVVEVTNSSVTISYQVPVQLQYSAPNPSYRIAILNRNTLSSRTEQTSSLSTTVTNLIPGNSYRITVQAMYGSVAGPESEEILFSALGPSIHTATTTTTTTTTTTPAATATNTPESTTAVPVPATSIHTATPAATTANTPESTTAVPVPATSMHTATPPATTANTPESTTAVPVTATPSPSVAITPDLATESPTTDSSNIALVAGIAGAVVACVCLVGMATGVLVIWRCRNARLRAKDQGVEIQNPMLSIGQGVDAAQVDGGVNAPSKKKDADENVDSNERLLAKPTTTTTAEENTLPVTADSPPCSDPKDRASQPVSIDSVRTSSSLPRPLNTMPPSTAAAGVLVQPPPACEAGHKTSRTPGNHASMYFIDASYSPPQSPSSNSTTCSSEHEDRRLGSSSPCGQRHSPAPAAAGGGINNDAELDQLRDTRLQDRNPSSRGKAYATPRARVPVCEPGDHDHSEAAPMLPFRRPAPLGQSQRRQNSVRGQQ